MKITIEIQTTANEISELIYGIMQIEKEEELSQSLEKAVRGIFDEKNKDTQN